MRGTLARPGGPLTSKPTRSNTSGCSTASAFFIGGSEMGRRWVEDQSRDTRPVVPSREEAFTPQGVVVVAEETRVIERGTEALRAEIEEARAQGG
jgi:hypothetical protein